MAFFCIAEREFTEECNGAMYVVHGRYLQVFDLANVDGTTAVLVFTEHKKADAYIKAKNDLALITVQFLNPKEMIVRLGELSDEPRSLCDSVIIDHTFGELDGQIGNIYEFIIGLGKLAGHE